MTYLLDTNAWVAALRDPTSSMASRFQTMLPADIRSCSIVVAELYHGCLRSAKPDENRAAVDALLAPFISLPFNDVAAKQFALIRHLLESTGVMIGPYDAQIAAIAIANSCTLVTHNVAEFNRVPGLTVVDWQI